MCVFCGKKELDYLDKLPSQKKRNSMLHEAGELHTLNNPNVKHVQDLTTEWQHMASVLRDSDLLSKLQNDVRANELFYHSNCLSSFKRRYENHNGEPSRNIKASYSKAVILEKTIDHLRAVAEKSQNQMEVKLLLEIYNKFLGEEGLPHETNITRFGNLILDYCCDWEIIKNKKVNLFILKDNFVKTALKYMHDDSTVAFLNNARKLLTPVRQSISKLSLEFDGNFNQIDSVPPELLSLMGLLIEDNASYTNPNQAT